MYRWMGQFSAWTPHRSVGTFKVAVDTSRSAPVTREADDDLGQG
jgi:hypothetical protein